MNNKYNSIGLILGIFVLLILLVLIFKTGNYNTKLNNFQNENINIENNDKTGAINVIKSFFISENNDKIPEITIVNATENHIKANVFFNPGGGYILASKVNNNWVKVLEGNGIPECLKINQYNFPESIVPNCINELGILVKNQWDSIKNAIINCEVKSIMQTHSLYVSAELKNKEELEGYEPSIDEIINLAIKSEEKCGKILMATE